MTDQHHTHQFEIINGHRECSLCGVFVYEFPKVGELCTKSEQARIWDAVRALS